MRYKKLLVVGGAGFVGSHLVDALVRHGAEKIVVVDNMFLGKMENLSEAIQKGNVIVYKEDARYLTALENIIDRERFGWVGKLESNTKQSLKLYASYAPGSSATEDETLTIIYRKGKFIVAGMDIYWEGGGKNGNCQYNFLTSQGYTAPGEFADEKTPIKAKVKPIPLSEWSTATRPSVCDSP